MDVAKRHEMISLNSPLRAARTHNTYVEAPRAVPSGIPPEPHRPVVTTQPVCKKPPPPPPSLQQQQQQQPDCQASIYCPHCNKCRCGQCTGRRELPRAWLCNNKYECSCQKCVDCSSCVCAVRAVFYHGCSNSDGDTSVSPSDEPCACCEQPHCCKRWTCMALMSLALPCLCLYWPLKCCLNVSTFYYNRCCRRHGCRCRRNVKGLLTESESSST